jgi:hypothetical protein
MPTAEQETRRRAMHERAIVLLEEAAALHQRAAVFFQEHDRLELAENEQRTAGANLAAAEEHRKAAGL